MTSHDVVAKARRILREKRIGHMGTLDPDAAGVLPVALGQATRLIELVRGDKSYRAQLLLGRITDSQDISGRIVEERPIPRLTRQDWEELLKEFRGPIDQIPPMVSAVSVGGKRLYEYARQGIEVERPSRTITINRIDIVQYHEDVPGELILDVDCSGGTYVRTLCHDIGQRLGCGAIMGWLIRRRSGPFYLRDSYTLEEVEQGLTPEKLVSPGEVLQHLPDMEINKRRLPSLKQGLAQFLPDKSWTEGQWIRMNYQGQLLAVGQAIWQDDRWYCQPRKVLQWSETTLK
ncbi:tRNA pseudouridine(55) synthase TruB [Heliobacterium chlorum]|uniref:tRNA pseudouridine synthase B n=2 Tax=Heliobacterium chlorum TaxID=2698 RepID=A0ABR7T7P4_HELCL|nr:tRNA pseudouridine(55) synthase TruB [Heliobacterium chlorum]